MNHKYYRFCVYCVVHNGKTPLFAILYYKFFTYTNTYKWQFPVKALLFGIWHITNVINPLLDGSMNIAMAILMGIGYILLSGILAYEWGMCAAMSETLWIGASEHLCNNFISN